MSTGKRTRDVLWGAREGLWYGIAFSGIAIIQLLVGGERVFRANDTTFLAVVAAYLLGGAAAGALVGLLRNWTSSKVGKLLTSTLAAVPIYLAIRIAIRGFSSWETGDTLGLIVLPVCWGMIGTIVFWRD